MAYKHYTVACIERAVSFIVQSLQEEHIPKLDEIAQASNLSKYHFHRLYRIVTGETCHQTITRLRLARGVAALSEPNYSVTDAGMIAGFSSSQSFAKAMKKFTSETATDLRADPERLALIVHKLGHATSINSKMPLAIELASIEPFEIVVTRTEGIYPELHQTYGSLFELAGGPEGVLAILGLPHGDIDGLEPEALMFECGLKVVDIRTPLPAAFAMRDVLSGHYLLARNVGSYDNLPNTVDTLYRYMLSNENIGISDQPLMFHYLDDPDETHEYDLCTDIYLKIDIAN